MSPKKKKRPQAAQALIDELLDDKNRSSTGSNGDDPVFLQVDDSPNVGTGIPMESDFPSAEIHLDDVGSDGNLSLDESISNVLDPVAQANKTAIANRTSIADRTQMAPDRLKRNLSVASAPEEKKSPAPFDGTRPVLTENTPPREESVSGVQNLALDDSEYAADETVRIKTPAPVARDNDPTQMSPARDIRQSKPKPEAPKPIERSSTEIFGAQKQPSTQSNAIAAASAVFASSEAALKQSESLRIAQSRITELEKELERIRRENEDLAAAGETLRRRADDLISKSETLEIKEREAQRMAEEERKVLRGQMQAKDRENSELRSRVEEIELRLESNFKKIRVRERELEHRLEIVKMESATLVSTKDKMILELKRELDQLGQENEFAKAKTQEMFSQYKDKQETIRRVVRALRIALTILEGDDETVVPLKKAE